MTFGESTLELIRSNWLGLISALVASGAWIAAYRSARVNVDRFRQEQEARKKAFVVVVEVERPNKNRADVVIRNAGFGSAIDLRAPRTSLMPLAVPRTGVTLPPLTDRKLIYDVRRATVLEATLVWKNPDGTEATLDIPLFKET